MNEYDPAYSARASYHLILPKKKKKRDKKKRGLSRFLPRKIPSRNIPLPFPRFLHQISRRTTRRCAFGRGFLGGILWVFLCSFRCWERDQGVWEWCWKNGASSIRFHRLMRFFLMGFCLFSSVSLLFRWNRERRVEKAGAFIVLKKTQFRYLIVCLWV